MSYPKDHGVLDYALPIAGACGLALSIALATTDPTPPPVGRPLLPSPEPRMPAPKQLLVASWYGEPYHGRKTASGEVYNQDDMTCASRSLPFGAVLFLKLGDRSAIVRVNDRGPWTRDKGGRFTRDLDLSRAAARQLGMIDAGEAIVEVRRLS